MKLCLISLGCDKNLVDSELLLGLLAARGYELTDDEEEAEVIVINTCCFILDAKEESIETILRAAQYKKDGVLRELVVIGCLAERYRDEIRREIPEVDRVVGVTEFEELLKREPPRRRPVSTGGWYAYLKIADGCDKRCTYCIIPSIRGSYRSYPMEYLLEQARQLAEDGVKELILVAQETTLYGKDLYGRRMLAELLRQLAGIGGLRWIRVMYAYPEEIDEELVSVMAGEPKICHYIDMPVQHADDTVLRRMGRRTTQADIREKIRMLRAAMPDIVIRTTLISGFPGETQAQHETLLDFVREIHFERLGVFAYSPEEGTPAEQFPDQVPDEVKEARREELMLAQQEISAGFQESVTGRVLDVMIEGRLPEEGVLVGSSYMDAPEIDGDVFVESARLPMSGDFMKVRVTGSSEYDLTGEEA